MTPPAVLYVGNDPSLEYLLGRYAQRSGCRVENIHGNTWGLEPGAQRPLCMWFSSLKVLEAAPGLAAAAVALDIPLVVCAAVADDTRAIELGADYVLIHPVTYDIFLSTLGQAHLPAGDDAR
jgi:hypothetical protein